MKWLLTAFIVLLIALGVATTVAVPWTLVTGWIPFLGRVLPRVTVDGRTVTFGIAAFMLFAAGIHWLGRSVHRPADGRRWRLGWSLAAVMMVVVLFAAGICLIGVVHQTGWLLSGDEPAIVEVERFHSSNSGSTSPGNLRQVFLGFENLNDAYQGRFPPMETQGGILLHNWITPALTWIGCSHEIDFKSPWNSPRNNRFFRVPLTILLNPSLPAAPGRDAEGHGLAQYAANCRAMKDGQFLPFSDYTNATAATLFIGEVNANFQPWGKPGNCRDPLRGIDKSAYGFGGPLAAGGANFAMADGSVRFIADNISPDVLKALASPRKSTSP